MSTSINRRQLLGTAATAGLALRAQSRTVRAAIGANEKARVAVMGTNSRGTALARGFAGLEGAEVVAICDVDPRAISKAVKAVRQRQDHEPKGFGDFRRVLDDRSVDALVIAAPDHWHAPAAILACAAGKHVYVEKPCSHNAREGEMLVAAARKHNRVVQMGNQRRSMEKVIEAIERLHAGVIGRVYYARASYANQRGSIGQGHTTGIPSWLDFELWQGPAPRKAYKSNMIHYNWHWFWHWGTSELGNNGIHTLDLCRWGLDVIHPTRVTSGGGRYHWHDDQQTPDTQVVTYDFPNRKSILWQGLSCNRHRPQGDGVSFHGEKGTLVLTRGGYTLYDLKDKVVETATGPSSDDAHRRNFLDCIRSGKRPNSDIEGGHQSTLLCHLGNIAHRTGRTINCDPRNGHILDDPEAAALWAREYESGWEPKV